MRKIIQYSLFLLVFVFAASQVEAQKIGHVDAQSIIFDMPEFKQARSSLDALAGQKQKLLQSQQEEIQKSATEAAQKQQRGELSPAQLKDLETKLQAEQMKLLKNEQKYQEDLLKKEEELTGPLYEKIRNAIQSVAKANGYKYVLEAASLLYAEETDNLTPKVKAHLGM